MEITQDDILAAQLGPTKMIQRLVMHDLETIFKKLHDAGAATPESINALQKAYQEIIIEEFASKAEFLMGKEFMANLEYGSGRKLMVCCVFDNPERVERLAEAWEETES